MSDKTLYCAGCGKKVALITEGSKIMKGMTCLCPSCETKRQASDLSKKTSSNPFDDIFGTIFNK